ncbi:MAG: aromatic ring-hydroxylating dioxygenase subunit alpha [Gammaproteobacteria bacterium]
MNDSQTPDRKNFEPYCGYHQTWEGSYNQTLAHTGPGTACGEYLRRYWHPVYIAEELGELPQLIKVLGEELVLFRDRSGNFGLVHKRCPHRRASLEYGRCETQGIRCCYHGWLFDTDGSILEVPGEPEDSVSAQHVMQNLRLGAYPVREFKGLLFAYLGPQSEQPEFPVYDTYDIPGMTMVPYAAKFNCNWIQVLDAIVDPVHTAFLHHSQFSDGFGELGEISFHEFHKMRYLGAASRRVGDNIWVRVNELILPNFTQSGAAFATDGTKTKYFGRSAFTRWVVPLDDEHCIAYAWGNFGDRGDPPEYNTPEGMQLIEQGELIDRSYLQKQRSPGDVEAVEGMGAISDHEKEYLVSGDRGITMYRNQIRKYCRNLQKGKLPPQPADLGAKVIPTYGSDTVLPISVDDPKEDSNLLRSSGKRVIDILTAADGLNGDERDRHIIEQLKRII